MIVLNSVTGVSILCPTTLTVLRGGHHANIKARSLLLRSLQTVYSQSLWKEKGYEEGMGKANVDFLLLECQALFLYYLVQITPRSFLVGILCVCEETGTQRVK